MSHNRRDSTETLAGHRPQAGRPVTGRSGPTLYFSTVTFTTLGYGDVTLDAGWRLFASIQAAVGTIMFGWTTAIVMAVLQRMATEHTAAAA